MTTYIGCLALALTAILLPMAISTVTGIAPYDAEVIIRDRQYSTVFDPPSLTISSGQTVAWFNGGVVNHWIQSCSPEGYADPIGCPTMNAPGLPRFSRSLGPGSFFYFTFNVSGVYYYYDIYDPDAHGSITVESSNPDFTIALNPSSVVFPQDSSEVSSNITLTSKNGFTGVVNLDFRWYNGSANIFVSLNNPFVPASGSATETVRVLNPPSSSAGCCAILTVTGTSGSLSHSSNLTIAIPPGPDFNISANPSSITVQQGTTGTSNITVTSIDNISGTVYFSAMLQTPGFFGGWGFYTNRPYLTPGGTASVMFQVYVQGDALPGTYVFTITGASSSHSHSTTVTVTAIPPIADFGIAVSPPYTSVEQGGSTTLSLTLRSINRFSGSVTVTADVSQAGLALDPLIVTVELPSGQTVSSSLLIQTTISTPPRIYDINLTATSEQVHHSVLVSVIVTAPPPPADFGIVVSPRTVTVQAGTSANATIAVAGLYGFDGTINLSTTITILSIPQNPTPTQQALGSTITLSPTTITLSSSFPSANSVLTIRIPNSVLAGTTFIVTVKASNGLQSHSENVTVTVTESPSNPTILGLPPVQFYGITGALSAIIVASGLALVSRKRPRPKTSA